MNYIVHRIYWIQGGTEHWFSTPVSSKEAKEIASRWQSISYVPSEEEKIRHNIRRNDDLTLIDRVEIEITVYKARIDYNDGVWRDLVFQGRKYIFRSVDKVTTIQDFMTGKEILKYRGDPSDREHAGVIELLKDEFMKEVE